MSIFLKDHCTENEVRLLLTNACRVKRKFVVNDFVSLISTHVIESTQNLVFEFRCFINKITDDKLLKWKYDEKLTAFEVERLTIAIHSKR